MVVVMMVMLQQRVRASTCPGLCTRLRAVLVDHLRVLRELEADLTMSNFFGLGLVPGAEQGLGLGLKLVRGFSMESRAVLSDTLSPRRHLASPGMASGPTAHASKGRAVSASAQQGGGGVLGRGWSAAAAYSGPGPVQGS